LEVLNFENLPTGVHVGLPTKLTRIYQIATKVFFFRHNEQYRDKRLRREDIESKDLPPELKPLTKIAFDGVRERKLIFPSSEVVQSALFHQLPDRQTAPLKHEAQFCFIHLTIQEFLAAKHIVDTMQGTELRSFLKNHINEGEWQMVMQFVAGLLGDGDNPSAISIFTELLPKTTYKKDESYLMNEYVEVPRSTVTCWPTASKKHLAVTLMKCIYESNESGSVVQSILEEIGFNAVDFSVCRLAPADCTAVVHVLLSCQQISVISLSDNNIGSLGCVEIVKLFGNCKLRSLNLRGNNLTDEGVEQLSNALVNGNCKLNSLNLMSNNLTDEGVKQLSNALVNSNCTELSSLNLKRNNLTDECVKQLSNALVNSNCKLRSLNLTGNKLTDEGAKQLSNALVNSNCKLNSLNLGGNNLTDEGVKQLSNALVNSNCKLNSLNLRRNYKITNKAKNQIKQANPKCKAFI